MKKDKALALALDILEESLSYIESPSWSPSMAIECRNAIALIKQAQEPVDADGYKRVPVEPTPEIIAAAAISVWPTASKEDIELARKAAPIVLMRSDLGPGFTLEMLAAVLATMAPAYRAMIAAAQTPPEMK